MWPRASLGPCKTQTCLIGILWWGTASSLLRLDVVDVRLIVRPAAGASRVFTATATSPTMLGSVELNELMTSPHDDANDDKDKPPVDQRPHEQRRQGARQARRMNHAFRYLYRNDSQIYLNTTAFEYLSQFYTSDEIHAMNHSFPPLLDLNVSRHLHPKVRFLQQTVMGEGTRHDGHELQEQQQRQQPKQQHSPLNLSSLQIPPQYFGARLEKTIAPRHAFLVHMGLPHGRDLLSLDATDGRRQGKNSRWAEFLLACRKTKRFCALCNQWRAVQQRRRQQKGHQPPDTQLQPTEAMENSDSRMLSTSSDHSDPIITSRQIEAFDGLFGRGLLAAARNELVYWNNTWKNDHIDITSTEILRLLIQHGANPLERDIRGVTLLHWAAGTGNLEALQALLPHFSQGLLERTERDGATLLHWGAAGANSKEFGTGGHLDICQFLLSECDRRAHSNSNGGGSSSRNGNLGRKHITTKELVNLRTKDGNSPLMWAAWSGSLDTVKLMIRHRAVWDVANRNGCTVAHWAASGGNLKVCAYLADVVGVDFFAPNHGGNTPLTHAVAFGRVEIVEWIRDLAKRRDVDGGDLEDDEIAARLAQDFVAWAANEGASNEASRKRRQVLQLFQDDFYDWSMTTTATTTSGKAVGVDAHGDVTRARSLSLEEAQALELEEY